MITAAHCTDVFDKNKTNEAECLNTTAKTGIYREEDRQTSPYHLKIMVDIFTKLKRYQIIIEIYPTLSQEEFISSETLTII
jgi:hypothetical protein